MEYCEQGDLQQYIDKFITEEDTKTITTQLLEGLKIMHQQGFTHRDLKPQNIFVMQKRPEWWVKIGDFGISKRVQNDDTSLKTEIGTRGHLAPEVLGYINEETSTYTNAVDMWSLGCIVFELLTQKRPFPNAWALGAYCQGSVRFPEYNLYRRKAISMHSITFIKRLLCALPDAHMSAIKALEHL